MKKTPIFIALFAVLFFVIFNYTLPIMGSIYIVGELGGSNQIAAYTVIFFALGNALGVPLGGPIAQRWGAVKGLVFCLLLFAFASYLCCQAATYAEFNIYRFFQGFVSGPFYVFVNRLFAALTTDFPEKKRDNITAVTLTIFAVGPVLGACFGGWISYDYEWRRIFYLNFPIVIFLAIFLGISLRKLDVRGQKRPFDAFGYIFYVFSILPLSLTLTLGEQLDWLRSDTIVILLIVGSFFFILFLIRSLTCKFALIDLRLLKHRVFVFGLFNLAILFSTYFATIFLLALWLSLYVDYTPIWVALLLGNMALAGVIPPFLVKRFLGPRDCRLPLTLAIIFFVLSCWHTMYFNVDINFGRIAFSRVLAGFALALFLPPIFRLCFYGLPDEKTVSAVTLFQIVRALSSGLGAAIFTTLWYRREIFYHERLGEKLTLFSDQTKRFFTKAYNINLTTHQGEAQLDVFLEREATSLALNDCFYLLTLILVLLLIVIILTCMPRWRTDFDGKKKKH